MTSNPFEGYWKVAEATLPNGKHAYSGKVTVQKIKDTPLMVWETTAGDYVGIGTHAGGKLYVAVGEHYAGLGVAIATPSEDGGAYTLSWSSCELDGVLGSGRMVRLTDPDPDKPFAGHYHMMLRLPNRRLLAEWYVLIDQHGAVYQMAFVQQRLESKLAHTAGLALPCDGGFALCWYPDMSQLAFMEYEIKHPDELRAVWALGSQDALGTERLTRMREDE
jgi:hypothetical protein